MTNARQQKIREMFETFMSLQKALGTRKDGFFKQFGLNRPQVHILYAIDHRKETTVKELASKMGITSSAATQLIEGLVEGGYLTRKHDKNDRRIVHVTFSDKGEKQFSEFKKAHMERMTQTFSVLTDAELDAFINVPKKVLKQIESSHQ